MGTSYRKAPGLENPRVAQIVLHRRGVLSKIELFRTHSLPLPSLVPSWVTLGGAGGSLGLFCEAFGLSWRPFGTLLGLRGDRLGVFWPPVAPFGALLGYLGVPLGPQGHLGGGHGGQDLTLGRFWSDFCWIWAQFCDFGAKSATLMTVTVFAP